MNEYLPKIFTAFRGYNVSKFTNDLMAGTIVGVVALPLAIAFAIASGVTPDRGLLTAIIAGFLISALGGSRVQIGGPTGAFVVIVYGVVRQHGVDGLLLATLLAGILLIVMALARFGSVIRYIPHPLVVGFTSGIAVIIFSGQIAAFVGLDGQGLPPEFPEQMRFYLEHAGALNPYALAVGAGSLIVTGGFRVISHRVPGSLVALILATLAVALFDLPVATIADRFGEIKASIPAPALPPFSFEKIRAVLPAAFTIAMLGAIESLLSAVVGDGMTGFHHRPNAELAAQGIANIVTPLFGGIAATGAIARTATNIKNGATTPLAGITHAVVLLLILLLFGKLAGKIPLAALAGILMVVAYNMSEWRSFLMIFRGSRSDIAVLLITFLLTVFIDLTIAIEAGLVLAALLFIRRVIAFSEVRVFADELPNDSETPERYPGIEIYEINGPFFFGISHKFEEAARIIESLPTVRLLRMRRVPFMDGTGIHALNEFCKRSQKSGIRVIFSGVNPQPLELMRKYGMIESIGQEYIFPAFEEALRQAQAVVAANGKTS